MASSRFVYVTYIRTTPEKLWQAYEQFDRSKVRGSGQRVLTDLVSLVRVALHQDTELVPYPDQVRERYRARTTFSCSR